MREAMPWAMGDDPSDTEGESSSGDGSAQPGWVLQSMVPSALVAGRKIHLRTYVVALRTPAHVRRRKGPQQQVAFYAYGRHEVRLAAAAMNDDLSDSSAHLTTGVWRRGGVRDDRTTLDAVPELAGVVTPGTTYSPPVLQLCRNCGRASETPCLLHRRVSLRL